MFKKFKKLKLWKAVILFGLKFTAGNVNALEVPALTGRIVDNAKIISSQDKMEISSYLKNLEDQTGIQIAVLTIKSLEGESLEEFSLKTAEKWKLGEKGKDNGALLLVALNERKIRIEVGYGLEERLTDTKCGLIIRNVIIPEFRNGDYSNGIAKGVRNMAGIAGNNTELISKRVSNPESSDGSTSVLAGLMFVFGWFVLFSCIASGRQNHFLPWIIFSSAYRSSHRSYGSDFSGRSGRSNFGSSFSGGGFSGHGGGFGGGGASGGW